MDIEKGCPTCQRPWVGADGKVAQQRAESALAKDERDRARERKALEDRLWTEAIREARVKAQESADVRVASERSRRLEAEERLAEIKARRYKRDEEECENARSQGRERARAEMQGELRMQKRENATLLGKLQELEARLAKRTANELGELGEFDCHAAVHDACPDDHVRRTGAGTKGGDTIQTVRDRGVECGTIVYESKNVAGAFNHKQWIPKAREDGLRHGAAFVVIVTATPPKRTQYLNDKGGIFVVRPDAVAAFACVLRLVLVEAHRRGAALQGSGVALQRYFTSGAFDRAVGAMRADLDAWAALEIEEQRKHADWWKRQGALRERLGNRIAATATELASVLEAPAPRRRRKKAAPGDAPRAADGVSLEDLH